MRHVAPWLQLLLLPLLLTSLLLPAGLGHVDLCQCDAGDHGLLCAPPATRSCCAKQAESEAPCKGCPSLDLASSVSPQLPARSAQPAWGAPGVTSTCSLLAAPADLSAPRPALGDSPRPPPRGPRLHLLLGVFRI